MKRFLIIIGMLCAAAAVAAQTAHNVYLIGDSTCADKELKKQNPERGWGQFFQPLFDLQVRVENHAVNGRSSKSFRDEQRWQPIYDKLHEGDYVFIQFGHNDQKIKSPDRYSTPDQYAENLRRYVRETREKGATPILLTPIVRRNFVDGVLTDTHTDYPAAVKRVAAEEQVGLIDMEAKTREWIKGLGDEASRRFFMWVEPGTCPLYPNGRQDNTHLRAAGAHIVSRMVAEELDRVAPELAKHLVESDFVVSPEGRGDFFTIAEAVAALPDFCKARPTVIVVCEGTYKEKISIPYSKRNVVMIGRGEVTVTGDDYAKKIGPTGFEMGTSGSSTVYFGADNWTVRGITFANTAGRVGQAVAVQTLGTQIRFVDCRFLGNQDTLYLHGSGNNDGVRMDGNTVVWFENCYVEGTTDFIFGAATALFDRCTIHSLSDSYITAASTNEGLPYGFVFRDCKLTAAEGVSKCYLGRPWRPYAQTFFVNCQMDGHIRPEGWHNWSKPEAERQSRYAEYGSTGEGADASARVKWARRLTRRDVEEMNRWFERKSKEIKK